MIARLFETPFIDILLIVLAIRFIWPGLFGIKSKKKSNQKVKEKPFIHETTSSKSSKKFGEDEGEYIDYEEIK